MTSASTLAECRAAYEDNCDYDLDGSVEKCRAFIQAVRFLKGRGYEQTRHGDKWIADTYLKWDADEQRAVAWLRARDTSVATNVGGSVRGIDLSASR